jgi:intraflagellar transport protein 81
MPLDVPAGLVNDETVSMLLQEYRHHQGEFKETHKSLERVAGGGAGGLKASPGELKKEIAQLEDERGQLIEKIASLKRKTGEMKGFAPLLDLTSSLRKEQEEEARLAERMAEQRAAVQSAERRYTEVNYHAFHKRTLTPEKT